MRRPPEGAPDNGATDRDPLPQGIARRSCRLCWARARHGTAVRLALIIMAAAGLAGILLVIARKALREV